MTATLSQSQAELPRLVEIASRGEEVLITVDGAPKAKLTRVDVAALPSNGHRLDVGAWQRELEALRRAHSTGKAGPSVDEILDQDRTDRV